MKIKRFYQGDYGDSTNYVAVEEENGKKTVVHRGLTRARAVECVVFGNEYFLPGTYEMGMNDYFDNIVEQILIIDHDRHDDLDNDEQANWTDTSAE